MSKVKSQKTKSIRSKKIGELIFFWSLLIIPLAQFCVFYIGVNFNSILLSFKSYDYNTGTYAWIGFDNFERFFKSFAINKNLMICLKNSLLIFAIQILIVTPISILFSYYIYKNGKRKFHKTTAATVMAEVSKVLLFLPTIIPSIAMVLMYKYFGENSLPDILNNILGTEFKGFLSTYKYSLKYIIGFLVLTGFGSSMVLYTGAMSSIDESLIESGQMDGVSPFKELVKIVFPAIFPTFTLQMVTSVAGIFINQACLFSFYGGGAPYVARTFGYELFITVSNDATMAEYPYAAAMGIVFTIIATPITLLTKYFLETYGPSTTKSGRVKEVLVRESK